MNIQIICLVWGKKYTQTMLELCFSSLLTDGNLFNWPYKSSTSLILYTTQSDWKDIQKHPVTKKIKQHIAIDKIFIDSEKNSHSGRYNQLINQHELALKNAADNDQSVIFIAPDIIFGTNSLTAIAQAIESGSQLVVTAGYRVQWDGIYPQLLKQVSSQQLSLSEQTCTELFVEYMHSSVRSKFLGSSQFNTWLSHIYYWTNPTQFVVRGFHLHPIFIRNVKPLNSQNSTIDGGYMQNYYSQLDQIKVITNAQLFLFSLTYENDQQEQLIQMTASHRNFQAYIDRFRRVFTLPIHQHFFQQPIILNLAKPSSHYIEFPHEMIDGLDVFWKIESVYKQQDFKAVIQLYEENKPLILQELNDSPFNVCLFFVMEAYLAVGEQANHDQIHRLIENLAQN